MAKELPPYTSSTGILKELFKKIQEAPPPPRFSQDYLVSGLKFKKSGTTNSFIPILKRLGFLSSDGAPTEIYKKFRNPNAKVSGLAMAEAIRIGYSDLYSRNEYWHKLNKSEFKDFLIEVLELEPKNLALNFISATVEALKGMANFETNANEGSNATEEAPKVTEDKNGEQQSKTVFTNPGLNLSYTINLNLPETADIKVFDAIFKSLKENILNK